MDRRITLPSKMFNTLILCASALVVSVVPAIPAVDPTRPSTGSVSVSDITVNAEGSGCRQGQVSVAVASDSSALTIIFNNFSAADGPNAVGVKTRAFCRIAIEMNAPGWAFDITSADFRGYVNLQQGVEASLVSRWKWVDAGGSDLKGKGNIHKIVNGPFSDDVLLHKDGELSDAESTVCPNKDAKLQISLSATVKSSISTASGLVQGSSQDVGFGQILNLSWKKC